MVISSSLLSLAALQRLSWHHGFLNYCLWRKRNWSSRQGPLLSLGSLSSLRWIINWNFAALPLYNNGQVRELQCPLTWALLHRHLLLVINTHPPNLHILISITLLPETKDSIFCREMAASVKCCSSSVAPGQLLLLKGPATKRQSVSI